MINLLNLCAAAIILQGGVSIDNHPGRIGILYNPDSHTVVKVYENSPAHLAGLKRKDKVIKVVDHLNDKKRPDIKGPTGSYVELTIQRGNQVFTITLERVLYESIDTRKIVKD